MTKSIFHNPSIFLPLYPLYTAAKLRRVSWGPDPALFLQHQKVKVLKKIVLKVRLYFIYLFWVKLYGRVCDYRTFFHNWPLRLKQLTINCQFVDLKSEFVYVPIYQVWTRSLGSLVLLETQTGIANILESFFPVGLLYKSSGSYLGCHLQSTNGQGK